MAWLLRVATKGIALDHCLPCLLRVFRYIQFPMCSYFLPHECTGEGKKEAASERLRCVREEGVLGCMFGLQCGNPYML